MEKRELREAHCPILKQAAKETSTVIAVPADQSPAAQPQAPSEERRVTFDIGDCDDVDNKERKVAFDIGDSDDTDCSNSVNGENLKKFQCLFSLTGDRYMTFLTLKN